MPGLKLLTKLDPQRCLKAAFRAAQDLGFSLTPISADSRQFTATKGNMLVSLLAGPFAPHCVFEISAQAFADANEVVLQKNKPWLTTGALGVSKVNQQADELMAAISSAIEKEGGSILGQKEF